MEMQVYNVIVRPAEEGGFWAEVAELPGCVTQGEDRDELVRNVMEAIQACLEAGTEPIKDGGLPKPEVWKVLVPTA